MTYHAIAIDGPAGAGKSTIARVLAEQLQFLYIDTGAMYRAIGWYAFLQKADPGDPEAVSRLLPEIHLELRFLDKVQHIFLNGEDMSDAIRTEEASRGASQVSAIPAVRAFLLDFQRSFAKQNNVLMDGRDIGTVVLPDADLKIFLTASSEARAARRFAEQQQRGEAVSYEAILENIRQRDLRDSTRSAAPLKVAEDAVVVDTTHMDFAQSLAFVRQLIRERLCV